jgi:hypothetical protein
MVSGIAFHMTEPKPSLVCGYSRGEACFSPENLHREIKAVENAKRIFNCHGYIGKYLQ